MSNERGLTPGEVELAKGVFGDAIDYSQVRIHRGKIPGILESRFQDDYTPVPTNGRDIYVPEKSYKDDLSTESKGSFIHLMAYVWQFQKGIESPEALKGFLKSNVLHQDRIKAMMELDVDPNKSFKDYNVEQRAQLLQDLYEIRDSKAHPQPSAAADPDGKQMLEKFTALAAQNPNSFMVKYATLAFGITKDGAGHYHVDPKKWADAQVETRKIEAEAKQRDDAVVKITAPFVADPHYLDPGRQATQTAPPAAKPKAPGRS